MNPLPTAEAKQVVFIIDGVDDWQSLAASVPAGAEFHLLDSRADAIGQIVAHLNGKWGIEAIHLFSHGAAGSLQLGSTTLNQSSLDSYASALATIGSSLTDNADILLYGCNVAAGDIGQRFIDALAAATGADVAASTDPSGSQFAGGNWSLEASSGRIETAVLEVSQFKGLLSHASQTVIIPGPDILGYGPSPSDEEGQPVILVTPEDVDYTGGGRLAITAFDIDYPNELDEVSFSYDGGANWHPLLNSFGDSYLRGDNENSSTTVFDLPAFTFASGVTTLQVRIETVTEFDPRWDFRFKSAELTTYENNVPTSSDGELLLDQDSAYSFSASDFAFLDSVDSGDTLRKVRVTNLPENGTLTLNGEPLAANQAIDAVDLAKLVYEPDTGYFGPDEFMFMVSDGYAYSVSSYKLSLTVREQGVLPSFGASTPTFNDDLIETDEGLSQSGSFELNAAIGVENVELQLVGATAAQFDSEGGIMPPPAGQPDLAALAAMLSYNRSGTGTTGTVDWIFDSGSESFDYLAAGETLVLSYRLKAIDSDYGMALQNINVTILGTDDPTHVSSSMPDNLSTAEDTPLSLDLSDIELSDVDTNPLVALKLEVQHGSLSFNESTSISVEGSGTATLILSGSLSDLIARLALYKPSYVGETNWNGTDILSVSYEVATGGTLSEIYTELNTIDITVEAVNDAPSLTGDAALSPVDEDSLPSTGTLVYDLFSELFEDQDEDDLEGIVITGNAAKSSEGNWQYLVNGGTTWVNLTGVSANSGLVLKADAKLRFVPVVASSVAAGFSGTPGALTVHAVDTSYVGNWTSASGRVTYNTTSDDASAPVSVSSVALTIEVTPLAYIDGGDALDLIEGTDDNDTIRGFVGNDTLIGGKGDDVLVGGSGVDSMDGGEGDDSFYVDSNHETVDGGHGTDTVYFALGDGIFVYDDFTYRMPGDVENLVLGGKLELNGIGNDLDNQITGNDNNNRLDGGKGIDTLTGGKGDDTYVVDRVPRLVIGEPVPGDTVVEAENQGQDLVLVNVVDGEVGNYQLPGHVENGTIISNVAFDLTGNELNNLLIGNVQDNVLDGGEGIDTMVGGAGNDTYTIDNALDVITEKFNSGIDLVKIYLAGDYTLGTHLENASLMVSGNHKLTGNVLDNLLTGNSEKNEIRGLDGNDTLDGGADADTLYGGVGNDTYIVDNINDIVIEGRVAGIDTVFASVNYTLASNVENLTLVKGSAALNATGNELSNFLVGNQNRNLLIAGKGDDKLDGGTDRDTMQGGEGNDSYFIDDSSDVVDELDGSGIDTVFASVSYTLNSSEAAGVENITLTGSNWINATGNALTNTLSGNSGDNILDGGAGADTMIGRAGDDSYIVDNVKDIVDERGGGGTDTVLSSVTFTLATATAAGVEDLTLTGIDSINATGNLLANTLTGNSGDNRLDGGTGADNMIGGAGDDTYIVDNASDMADERGGSGTDTVLSSVTYTLATDAAAGIEHLTLTGNGSINATGNSLNNRLTGNAGNNILDGGSGTDTLIGGAGNDTYRVNDTGITITELKGGGIDTVLASVSHQLASEVEILTLTGSSSINATGNALANRLTGNSGNNSMDGGAGNDTLVGGKGTDELKGGAGSDRFVFAAGDTGQSAATLDKILDFAKGNSGKGDVIDYSVSLSRGGSAAAATDDRASTHQLTGIASFKAGSGTTLEDALYDIAACFTANRDSQGEFAFFKVNGTGDYHLFISDGLAGVTDDDLVIQLVGIASIGSINLGSGDLKINT